MKPSKLVKRKIDERYKKAPFLSIDKFLRQNPDVDKYLTDLVDNNIWFENKRRAFSNGFNVWNCGYLKIIKQ